MLVKEKTLDCKYVNIYSLNNKSFGIPIFQRFYAWKKEQTKQLQNDLLETANDANKQLYFLDFIYYEDNNKIYLADGQQRLITINILIQAIKDVAKERSIVVDDLNLFSVEYDIPANNDKYNTNFYNYPTAPFKGVYLELRAFVLSNVDKINQFIKTIKNNIYIYLKKCDNADDAFLIFQQINTGGKPLTKDEVIKTAIDQYAKAYGISINTNKIKELRQSIISYYKLKSTDYSSNFDNMAIITFLKDFVTKDKETFKNFAETILILNKLSNSPFKYVINYINRATLFDVINILAMKGIDIDSNVPYKQELLLPLCMMSICLSLNNGNPSTFKYLLNDVITKIKNNEKVKEINYMLIERINQEATSWKIPLETFKEKLGDPTVSKSLKKALMILDLIDKNISGTVHVDTINLEHIYPQKPEYTWAKNNWPSDGESQKVLIDNIGNYLLLCESVNKKIQNQYITEKVVEYEKIIPKDLLLQTPLNTVNFVRFEKEQDKYIFERQEKIAELIKESLPLGKVLIN